MECGLVRIAELARHRGAADVRRIAVNLDAMDAINLERHARERGAGFSGQAAIDPVRVNPVAAPEASRAPSPARVCRPVPPRTWLSWRLKMP